MKNNILVIGNGFDLMHKRKTKYSHFLGFLKDVVSANGVYDEVIIAKAKKVYPSFEKSDLVHYFIKQYERNIAVGNWIDMELDLKMFIKTLLAFMNDESGSGFRHGSTNYRFRYDSLPVYYRVLLGALNEFNSSKTKSDFILKKKYIDSWGYINKRKILSTLIDELKGLTGLLEFYWAEVEPTIREKKKKKVKIIEDIDPVMVISFNYTDTFETLYGKPDKGMAYVHGRLGEGNIVLGYDDDGLGYDDIAFKKYYQRLIYGTESKLSLEVVVKGVAKRIPIHFIGHSLDASDEDFLRVLINGEGPVHIHCRNEQEKNERIANVIKLIGKEKTIAGMTGNTISFEISLQDDENELTTI